MFIAILVLLLNISLHELGHARAQQRYGVELKSIGVLGIGKTVFRFKLRPIFGDVTLQIGIFPMGAYVVRTPEGGATLMKLPYWAAAPIHGAGPSVNFALACALGALFQGLRSNFEVHTWPYILLYLGFGALFLLANDQLSRYVYPVVALAVPAYFIYAIRIANLGVHDLASGPVSQLAYMHHMVKETPTFTGHIMLGFVISAGAGLMNLLPLPPFDGSALLRDLVKAQLGSTYEYYEPKINFIMGILTGFVIGFAVYSDIFTVLP